MGKFGKAKDAVADFIGDLSTGNKVALGAGGVIGVGGVGALAIGAIKNSSADRKEIKGRKLLKEADKKDDDSKDLMVAGAIATTGVTTAGIATAIAKSVK